MKTYEIYSGKRGNGARDRSVDDIERDLGSIRSEMSSTLRAIESKLSGGDVVGQIVGQLRGGGAESSELLRNAASVARANPIPVALIATGIGAILLAGSEGTSGMGSRVKQQARERVERYRAERGPSQTEGGESGVSERAREAASQVSERARDAKGTAQARLHEAREGASRRIEDVSGRAREQTEHARERIRHGSERAREGLRTASNQGRRVVEDEPLVLVGLGLAAGAALAASLPLMREGRERYRQSREREREQQTQGYQAHEVEIVSEAATGIEWQEEPNIGPDVSRPEYPEDDSTTYR